MADYEEVVGALAGLMESGEYGPGSRLPSERALATRLGASRGVIREALRGLAEKGLVVSRRGDGTYVDSGAGRRILDLPLERVRRARELFQFRRILEPGIAALAAENATSRDLEKLKVLVCDQQAAQLAGRYDAESDMAFHVQLARATGNRVLVEAVTALSGVFTDSRSRDLMTPARAMASAEHHLRIIDAVGQGDPDAARAAMESHLETIEQTALDD